jgi:hypothetical protein
VVPLATALGSGHATEVGEALRRWLPQLSAHSASQAIAGLGQQAMQLLGSPELEVDNGPTRQVRHILEQLSALQSRAVDFERFEDAAIALSSLNRGDWRATGWELIRQLGLR